MGDKDSFGYKIIKRKQTIKEMLGAGYSRNEILQYGSSEWEITERQVDTYLADVYKEIKEDFEKLNSNLPEEINILQLGSFVYNKLNEER